jgi:outer membrane translocation and assembly module TamA
MKRALTPAFVRRGFLGFLVSLSLVCVAQTPKTSPSYPTHLPYGFSNFVWWSDEELRALLKERIPGLGDEIATTRAAEGKIREALTTLLKEKGISAEVQSEEPSLPAFVKANPVMLGAHLPEPPHPAITFSLLTPKVVIGKLIFKDVPEDIGHVLEPEVRGTEGKPFNAGWNKYMQKRLAEVLADQSYLDAQVQLNPEAPTKKEDRYLVDLVLSVTPGLRYRVASLSADGGPLLKEKDLSRFFALKPGDYVSRPPFGPLGLELRALYVQQGYADVDIESSPEKDPSRALVSYHLTVESGPLYHLRTLVIQHLDNAQEAKVREIFSQKAGDIYDERAINRLYHKVPDEPLLKGLGFSFSPKRDHDAATIDLTLDFYKEGGEATVTIK